MGKSIMVNLQSEHILYRRAQDDKASVNLSRRPPSNTAYP